MGLAASQARLLTITARLSDNELRSQTINNAKMRLAAQSSQASQDYLNALNNATLQFTSYDEVGDSLNQPLTFNALSAYSAYNTQYGLVNSSGQLLVSEAEADIFKQSGGNLNKFLADHGLEFTTTYFEQPNVLTDLQQYFRDRNIDLTYVDGDLANILSGNDPAQLESWYRSYQTVETTTLEEQLQNNMQNYQATSPTYNNAVEGERTFWSYVKTLDNKTTTQIDNLNKISDASTCTNSSSPYAELQLDYSANCNSFSAIKTYLRAICTTLADNEYQYIDNNTATEINQFLNKWRMAATSATHSHDSADFLSYSEDLWSPTTVDSAGKTIADDDYNFTSTRMTVNNTVLDATGSVGFGFSCPVTRYAFRVDNAEDNASADLQQWMVVSVLRKSSSSSTYTLGGSGQQQIPDEKVGQVMEVIYPKNFQSYPDADFSYTTLTKYPFTYANGSNSPVEGTLNGYYYMLGAGERVELDDILGRYTYTNAPDCTNFTLNGDVYDYFNISSYADTVLIQNDDGTLSSIPANDGSGQLSNAFAQNRVVAVNWKDNAIKTNNVTDSITDFTKSSVGTITCNNIFFNTARNRNSSTLSAGTEQTGNAKTMLKQLIAGIGNTIFKAAKSNPNFANLQALYETVPSIREAYSDYFASRDGFVGAIFDANDTVDENGNPRPSSMDIALELLNAPIVLTPASSSGSGLTPANISSRIIDTTRLTTSTLSDTERLLTWLNAYNAEALANNTQTLNLGDAYLEILHGYMLDVMIESCGTPKYAWIDKNGVDTTNADAKAQWYTNLFKRMQQGYAILENGLAASKDWIDYALRTGIVTMEQVDKSFMWRSLDYKCCTRIVEVTDDTAVAKAEAEYNRAMNDIKAKDNIYDLELKNIDTEHNALQQEYNVIKGVISKNIERTMKFNQSA